MAPTSMPSCAFEGLNCPGAGPVSVCRRTKSTQQVAECPVLLFGLLFGELLVLLLFAEAKCSWM